jgi:hypothetical protein
LADLIPGHEVAPPSRVRFPSPQKTSPQSIHGFEKPRLDVQRHQVIYDRSRHYRLHEGDTAILGEQLSFPKGKLFGKLVKDGLQVFLP